MKKLTSLLALTLSLLTLQADTVYTKDGSTLSGTITSINDGVLTLETSYAGTLSIKQESITRFTTKEAASLRLESGSTMNAPVESTDAGELKVKSSDGTLSTKVDKVAALWRAGAKDPQVIAAEEAAKANERKWKYKAAFDLTGSSGNTDKFGLGANFDATLASNDDELKFYASIDTAETEGTKTSEEVIGGISYTSYVKGDYGWYVREELESDEFENIDLRSTTGAGLSYRFFDEETQKLSGQVGLAYRYESFTSGGTEDSPSLDFGLAHFYKYEELATIDTNLSLVPSIDDFSNYLLDQDTGVELPITAGGMWKLRMGVSNKYNSEPSAGNKDLDTTYYTRLILSWE